MRKEAEKLEKKLPNENYHNAIAGFKDLAWLPFRRMIQAVNC